MRLDRRRPRAIARFGDCKVRDSRFPLRNEVTPGRQLVGRYSDTLRLTVSSHKIYENMKTAATLRPIVLKTLGRWTIQ